MIDKAHFILSRSAAIKQYNAVKAVSDVVSYSFKTNTEVGKVLEEHTDCMFCIHSPESPGMIKDKKRIWFFAQAWDDEELDILTSMGLRSFVVDNEKDLETLLSYVSKKMLKVNLMLRARLKENTVHTGKYFVFGMYSREIKKHIAALKGNDNIETLGIHFHRKTQNVAEWSLKREISEMFGDIIRDIDVFDIGGGIPIEYRNYRELNTPSIFERIRELKEWLNENGVKLIAEPGRFICGPAVRLETRVKNVYDRNIIVNCSVYNSAMDTIVANIKLPVENELESGTPYTIKGCTPCSTDMFRYRVFLDNPQPGNKITFTNAGAYTYTTDFCNLKKPETKIVD